MCIVKKPIYFNYMDSKVAAVLNPPVYEDFEASTDLVEEKDCDTILLTLPGIVFLSIFLDLMRSKKDVLLVEEKMSITSLIFLIFLTFLFILLTKE